MNSLLFFALYFYLCNLLLVWLLGFPFRCSRCVSVQQLKSFGKHKIEICKWEWSCGDKCKYSDWSFSKQTHRERSKKIDNRSVANLFFFSIKTKLLRWKKNGKKFNFKQFNSVLKAIIIITIKTNLSLISWPHALSAHYKPMNQPTNTMVHRQMKKKNKNCCWFCAKVCLNGGLYSWHVWKMIWNLSMIRIADGNDAQIVCVFFFKNQKPNAAICPSCHLDSQNLVPIGCPIN